MIRYPTIAKLGTILGLWAHPDDETWCAGGILAAAAANGQRVVCVTATRGEAGEQHDPLATSEPLGSVRERELRAALNVLGIREHHWLNYYDGQCHTVDDQEAAAHFQHIIEASKPDTILTFGPDGLTGHPDHQAVSRWTDLALHGAKLTKTPNVFHKVESKEYYEQVGRKIGQRFNIYFMIDQPPLLSESQIDLAFRLPPELKAKKLQALGAQSSQMHHILSGLSQAELDDFAAFEGFRLA